MKTVEISDNTYAFFAKIAKDMEAQNNRATQYPLYYVYQKDEVLVADGMGYDRVAWVNEDFNEVSEFEVNGRIYKTTGIGEEWTVSGLDLTFQYEELDQSEVPLLEKRYLKEIDVPIVDVGPFLTEKAAQAHIDANYYHYYKPYIFVNSCWRNSEMQAILKLIFEMYGISVPSQYR